jgi:hypothetical protein
MNKSVEHYISELLFLHDCVIVPKFGGFVSSKKAAQLNRTTHSLSPPSKQILFNTNLKTNDGLLIAHIANEEGMTLEKAKSNVEIFSNKSNSKLTTLKVLRIPKIGLFTVAEEGNIIFSQDSTTNYNLDSFGMQSTYNKSIIRKTEATKQVEVTVQRIKNTNRSPKALLRAAAIIIPLLALSYLSISQQERINDVYTQMATLNLFATTKTANKMILPNTERILNPTIAITANNNIIKEINTSTIISQKTYYIIAGAFTKQKNAKRMLAKLNKWEYNASLVKGDNLLRVSYDEFNNKDKAILALNKIKQENPEAWLLTK